ncbi:DUF89 family protein [Streptomyces dangxiongensis]|uniref:DUF89 family protein n=1 Tax=Streptomyces dangxiongensis TaxID=1442032 RepID=A0A3G2JNE6_9ACTN|nr:ARMT1-like domain-containing protein [Streptomyces dangxiongensis]AYN43956.1 DUF89 family protein [Streptomyces dangxiongensis]
MTEKTSRASDEEASRDVGPMGAPAILSNEPGSFAWGVLAKRHPALIQQVRDAFPYGRRQREALDALLDEITNGVIEPLGPLERDNERWADWRREYFGRSWYDAPFLWAESYFYRRLLGVVGYFGAGPWQGVDPFAPFKQAELRGEAVEEELRALDALADAPPHERATALLHASLWGNRADLGFSLSAGEPGTTDAVTSVLTQAPGEASRIGGRLWKAMAVGTLEVRTHPFFCAPLPYEEMPEDLRVEFESATLTILKGDLNYRRLVGDQLWHPTTPFADRTQYFPGAVAVLRTLKSDVIVGLEQETVDALELDGAAWRTSGTHALIQVRP